jgi:hypothetical protein
MMDFTSTQAQAKEVAPPTCREGGVVGGRCGQAPLSGSPPLTADGVVNMYHQLA